MAQMPAPATLSTATPAIVTTPPVAAIPPVVAAQPVMPEQPKPEAQPITTEQPKPVAQPVSTELPKPVAQPVVAIPPVVAAQPVMPEQPKPVAQPEPEEAAAPAAAFDPVPVDSSCIPLPGEEDSIFTDMVPLIPGLIVDLSDAMADAVKGKDEKKPQDVEGAANRIGGKARRFGLVRLEHLSQCVERAAAEQDVEAMEYVLADLESWVTRYKDALQRVHREMRW
jgi:Predicted membrane protein